MGPFATTVRLCHVGRWSAKSRRDRPNPLPRSRAQQLTRPMRVTKFEHAALRIDKEGSSLLIDPGSFTLPLAELASVVAVVLTHEHPDHWTPEHLDRIRASVPD